MYILICKNDLMKSLFIQLGLFNLNHVASNFCNEIREQVVFETGELNKSTL